MKDSGEKQQQEEEEEEESSLLSSSTLSSSVEIVKHICKVCKRGFGCASALGGHMRSHGIGEDASCNGKGNASDFDYRNSEGGGGGGGASKHSYFLRKTNRVTSYRAVEMEMEMEEMLEDNSERKKKSRKYDRWYYDSSEEEEDLANCLVMLSNNKNNENSKSKEKNRGKKVVTEIEEKGTVLFQCKACKNVFSSHQALGGHRASHKKVKGCYYATAQNEEAEAVAEEEDLDADLLPLSSSSTTSLSDSPRGTERHSHNLDQSSTVPKRKSKEHECSICHRVFSSGQALGGHKRCHWLTTTNNFPVAAENTIIPQSLIQFGSNNSQLIFTKPIHNNNNNNSNILPDLNSPPLIDNDGNSNFNYNLFKYGDGDSEARIAWGNKEQGRKIDNDNGGESHELNRRLKVPKLSDLRDTKVDGGGRSGWLQVGISSTTE